MSDTSQHRQIGIIAPTSHTPTSAADSPYGLAEQMDHGKPMIPLPAEKIRDWPQQGGQETPVPAAS